ncbi:MAG: hypothetical protein JRJ65_18040 [Deltaproteobacteria bacterium]|nr:hypothetical protein [Deltaproteobacteria bacterium]
MRYPAGGPNRPATGLHPNTLKQLMFFSADPEVPMPSGMYRRRLQGHQAIGYEIAE